MRCFARFSSVLRRSALGILMCAPALVLSSASGEERAAPTSLVFKTYHVTGGTVTVDVNVALLAASGGTVTGDREPTDDAAAFVSSTFGVTGSTMSIVTRDGHIVALSGELETAGDFHFKSSLNDLASSIGDFELVFEGNRGSVMDRLAFGRDVFDMAFETDIDAGLLTLDGTITMGLSLADFFGDMEAGGSEIGYIEAVLQLEIVDVDQPILPGSRTALGGGNHGHDVMVCVLHESGLRKWGSFEGIAAYSIATTSGNAGTEVLPWLQNGLLHPVIPQNMYRLKDGRFEQIGMSWLKHGFCALQGNACNYGCQPAGGGCPQALGVGCTDPYSATRNGSTGSTLGPHYQVNAWSGEYVWPPASADNTNSIIRRRLQVALDDLDPDLNPGALYFGEAKYVHLLDAEDRNHYNNESYRRITVGGFSNGAYTLTWNGSTVIEAPALRAWAAFESGVTIANADVAFEGRFVVGSKVSDNGDGTWHYEYAIYNMNSDRSARGLSIPIPEGVTVTDIGFHDVDYHSGEPYSLTDWAMAVAGGVLTWSTQTFEENPNANALRWNTLYNFRFDADAAPVNALATIDLFKPGTPNSIILALPAPEAAQICAADLDGSGDVDAADLAVLLGAWGPNPGHPADIDGDGTVGASDLAMLLGNWGPCP